MRRSTAPSDIVELVIPPEHVGARADKVIAELLARAGRAIPRAEVQRWIAQGLVTVASAPIKNRTPLAAGTKVQVVVGLPLATSAEPDSSVVFGVIYQDADIIVVDKPAGLVVHPARGHRGGTLVNGLLARGGFELAAADERDREGHLRPGIVHRLDKDTSGLLVIAKHARAREALKLLFARHDIERSYLAIVEGRAEAARWDTLHGRHPKSRMRFSSRVREGRRAITRVEPLELLARGRATLVRCTLETGRTHQIRVHLSERSKTPILADPLYGRTPADADLARIANELGRQALHAAVLGFVHPVTGARMRWESPLPLDMRGALDGLRAL
jgi:23S rRNA pseudouridine1911/1915/1917 synthase